MKPLFAFLKKEYLETARTGKFVIIIILFVLFGVMNPAIAKLMPWMMELVSDTMSESGWIITEVQVDAMTSWIQFFKNIPIALIAYVLLFGDIFTKEYHSGTLLLALTKGLSRYKVVFAKTILLLSLWTLGYALSFAITYGYNDYYWDNGIANHLFAAVTLWWLFGVWVLCFIVLFSVLLQNGTSVCLCAGMMVLLAYIVSLIPKIKVYSPTMLMDANSLLMGVEGIESYVKVIVVSITMCIVCIVVSIPAINKKQL
jgi:ABC-2 type transport system permease protein